MKYLNLFNKEMKFWFKKDKVDLLTFNILFFNLEGIIHLDLYKDYRSKKNKKSTVT